MTHPSAEHDHRDGAGPSVGARGGGPGFSDDAELRSKAESLGQRLLGSLIDRAHRMPPRLLAPLLAQEITAVGGREVTVHLQDYDQAWLRPLPGEGLAGTEQVLIEGSWAGRAFSSDQPVEHLQGDGSTRLFLPMLDGSDRVGVLAFTLPRLDDDDRRLARRPAGLSADMVVTKAGGDDELRRPTADADN